ncbi:hypothetical protein CFOL_v3_16570 [Cephalotus follicularis]|uniref:CLAVATA3/ESR (CLE)-related protein 25 n=1 Tax=Cephalotus follicularis TaxID=3775 RepID=A0A1Q3BZ91_CEPFO|nr:hypothetical protein CFOL_v3_16570 [Cephalotus follicularis]
MGRSGRISRVLFAAVILVGFTWFFFVGILADHATRTTTKVLPSTGNFKHWVSVGRDKHFVHQHIKLNVVSKRRVPSGPDPIHNRRAFKSRQPPGRA